VPLLEQSYGPYALVDAAGYQMLLDFRGGSQRFRQISFAEIIDRPELAETLRDRVVLVGTAALSIKDNFATPFSTGWGGEGSLIGIALHGHVADQLIRLANGESRNRVPLPRLADDVAIWAAAMAGAVLALLVWRVLIVLLALLFGLALVGGATAWGFASGGLLLPGVPVALAWLLSAAGCNLVMHSVGLRERNQLRRSFESYLDPRIISQMMQGDTLPSFGGEHREITAIFTDIADFTRDLAMVSPDRPLSAELRRTADAGYLRGADMWHVACALFLAPNPGDLTFLTLDVDQRAVARRLGFGV